MTTPISSVYRFSLKPGVQENDFLAVCKKVQSFFDSQSGFQYRSLAKTDGDVWVDILYWDDEHSLNKTSEAFNRHPDCQNFINMVDTASITVDRARVIYSVPCSAAA